MWADSLSNVRLQNSSVAVFWKDTNQARPQLLKPRKWCCSNQDAKSLTAWMKAQQCSKTGKAVMQTELAGFDRLHGKREEELWLKGTHRLLIQGESSTAAGRGQCRSPWADEELQVSNVLRQSRDEGTSEVHWDHRLVKSWWMLSTEADFQHFLLYFINSISSA